MILKMGKPLNKNLIKKMLLEEDKFISDIFSKMPLPITELVAQNGHSEFNERYTNGKPKKIFTEGGKRAQTFEELHAKLNELKGKKLTYKEKLVKKGFKNKIIKKAKREERLLQKKLARIGKTESAGIQSDQIAEVKEENDIPKVPKQKPIFNSKGNMVFSKFDFSEIGTKRKPQKTEKDPKKILEQIKEKKKKIKEFEEAGEKEKAVEIKEKEAWKAALAKASGEKVKDDPELLKKSIKKEEQRKAKSRKNWESRKERTQNTILERQQKRTENIMKRKKDVKTNKLKRASKKGRIIPGF